MKMLRALVSITLMSFAVTGCQGTSDAQPIVGMTASNQIFYSGPLTEAGVSAFDSLFNKQGDAISELVITSGGGDAMAAIEMGTLVFDHGLSVIVRNICASSCANYIVPAGKSVVVEKDSLLGWHGGSYQDLYVPFGGVQGNSEHLESLRRWQAAELAFFAKVGVDPVVTIVGMMPDNGIIRTAPLFSYDQDTLVRLGLSIEFVGKPAQFDSQGVKLVQIIAISAPALEHLRSTHSSLIKARLTDVE